MPKDNPKPDRRLGRTSTDTTRSERTYGFRSSDLLAASKLGEAFKTSELLGMSKLGEAFKTSELLGASKLGEAFKTGGTHVTPDADALIAFPEIEVIVEATGVPAAGIRHALRHAPRGVELGMNITVTKGNYELLEGVAQLAWDLGLRWLNIQFLTPFGRATRSSSLNSLQTLSTLTRSVS